MVVIRCGRFSTADVLCVNTLGAALVLLFFLIGPGVVYGKSVEIVGRPEEPFAASVDEYDVLEEGLVIRDGNVYISIRFRDSSADIGSTVYTRHYINDFLLSPDDVKFDKRRGEVFYAGDRGKIGIGKIKRILGLFTRVILYDNVKIITSPYDARLVVSYEDSFEAQLSTREMVEILLSQRCTQCHTADYIFNEHRGWTDDDWLHVLHRMQSKGPALLSNDEVEVLAQYLAYQRDDLRVDEIKEPERIKRLKQRYLPTEEYVKLFEKNKCVNCHTIGRVLVILHARPWSREKWTGIITEMQKKDPKIAHEINVKEVVDFLYKLKREQSVP